MGGRRCRGELERLWTFGLIRRTWVLRGGECQWDPLRGAVGQPNPLGAADHSVATTLPKHKTIALLTWLPTYCWAESRPRGPGGSLALSKALVIIVEMVVMVVIIVKIKIKNRM